MSGRTRALLLAVAAAAALVELETLPVLGVTVAVSVVVSVQVAALREERRAADLIMRRNERLGWGARREWSLSAGNKLHRRPCLRAEAP